MGDVGVGWSESLIIDDISIMSFLLSFCFKTWGVWCNSSCISWGEILFGLCHKSRCGPASWVSLTNESWNVNEPPWGNLCDDVTSSSSSSSSSSCFPWLSVSEVSPAISYIQLAHRSTQPSPLNNLDKYRNERRMVVMVVMVVMVFKPDRKSSAKLP